MVDIRINERLGQDYHLCMVERPNIPTSKKKIEFIDVDGRENGALTKEKGYEDVEFTVKFNLLEDENIKPLLRKIKAWIMSAKIVSFTDDYVYRKIKSVEIGDIDNEIEEYGKFEVLFKADPYEYAIEQPITITNPITIMNQGTLHSLPKLTIYGTGNITIQINGISFQVKNVNSFVIVDSDLMECYYNTTPMNDKMVGKFPTFKEGENAISWSGSVSKIDIETRWRYI
ncbi:phage tail protein [Bacillus thuringiensis LM1212]|uniref:phage tail family protein n=1 Tax=Bacillus cereus group TaxID=86661 RepID=UPI00041B8844|nr:MULTISPECIES: phage tail family protein [Bacillus cereus group]AXY08559.1 phage tail protein [Bacillus thuringiensis LM1212]AXY10586.1 phage tail protein [Bacillus thuringiensis LM1212]QDF23488.1 phage tail protein [Bacillus tropicus]QDF26848.1 phage tail protein [Bacillus tropicus]QUG94797.1 phage tail protein [Bacillus tropicus]